MFLLIAMGKRKAKGPPKGAPAQKKAREDKEEKEKKEKETRDKRKQEQDTAYQEVTASAADEGDEELHNPHRRCRRVALPA